ncbi:MAG: alpha/beta hydrolase [Pseudomonadota bacterium]
MRAAAAKRSITVRAEHAATLDRAYGADPRQAVDVFLPADAGAKPLLIFVHGGYWQLGCREDVAYLAPPWTALGVAVATIGYRLAPTVTLPDIVVDVCSGLTVLRESAAEFSIDLNRVVLAGHSAGAHLAAMASASDPAIRPTASLLISGVYDIGPLQSTTPGEALTNSQGLPADRVTPLSRQPGPEPAFLAVGADETDAFRSQTELFAAYCGNWGRPTTVQMLAGKNHFNALDCLKPGEDEATTRFVREHLGAT